MDPFYYRVEVDPRGREHRINRRTGWCVVCWSWSCQWVVAP